STVRLAYDPDPAVVQFVAVIRFHGHRAAELPPIRSGRPAEFVVPGPLPPLQRQDDLEPLDALGGPTSGNPAQLVGDVIEVRPREARRAVVARMRVKAPEHRIAADVEVLDRSPRPLERLLVPVAHPVRLAVFRLERIRGPQDRHLARTLLHAPRPAVPDQESVRLTIVRLDRRGDEADESAAVDNDIVHGGSLR